MPPFRTHYDNLKVARDAPIEVSSAAYRSLSKKYHPDNNPKNTDAARIMIILNAAYEVLSDPVKRKQHDLWIVEKEQYARATYDNSSGNKSSNASPTPEPEPETVYQDRPDTYNDIGYSFGKHVVQNWGVFLFIAIVIVSIIMSSMSTTSSPSRRTAQSPVNSSERTAPNLSLPSYTANYLKPKVVGSPWTSTGYVKGYPRKAMDGYSTVTVDNTQNDQDVFVKLFSLDARRPTPVRYFVILAHDKFTVKKVKAGNYDVRYKYLMSNRKARTEQFDLTEAHSEEGVRYTTLTLTLYKVRGGNLKTYDISEEDFE